MTPFTDRPVRIPYAEISRKLVADSERRASARSTGEIAARIRRSIRGFARAGFPSRPGDT